MGEQVGLDEWVARIRARDEQLDRLEEYRSTLIGIATGIADSIANTKGTVTSPEVLAEMREDPATARMLATVDPRFMGAVFRAGKGWRRVGHTCTGSHARPVSVWERSVSSEQRSSVSNQSLQGGHQKVD